MSEEKEDTTDVPQWVIWLDSHPVFVLTVGMVLMLGSPIGILGIMFNSRYEEVLPHVLYIGCSMFFILGLCLCWLGIEILLSKRRKH